MAEDEYDPIARETPAGEPNEQERELVEEADELHERDRAAEAEPEKD